MLDQPGDIERLLAIARLRHAVRNGVINAARIESLREAIESDIQTFKSLMDEPALQSV